MQDKSFDIIIVGAGIVGLSLANALKQCPLRIAIIDAKQPQDYQFSGSYQMRVSAITESSRKMLQQLAAWDIIADTRISPFRQMHVWDAVGGGEIDFSAAELGVPQLGHIIENDLIIHALHKALGNSEQQVELLAPIRLSNIEHSNDGVTLNTEEGQTLQTRLLVAADGANSWVREQLAIPMKTWAYGQQAIVATVETEYGHQQTAWQRFLPTGPLAFLPLKHIDNKQCSIVWSSSEAESLMALDDLVFQQQLAEALDYRLGNITGISKRVCFPLTMRHVKQYTQANVALIGDAAHTIHPLAGQGVNLGIQDAMALAQVISDAQKQNRNFAASYTLRKYERMRKGDNIKMITAMEAFKRLFSNNNPALSWLRSMGLQFTNQSQLLKHFFANKVL